MKIWMYWEGPLPEWIKLCQESVEKHANNSVLILNDATFKDFRVNDAVDISGLYVAHKADYIRAHMLRHYGGLWIDSDCLVIQSLVPLLRTCELWDFVAFKQWSGNLANSFIGAKKDSRTAKVFYDSIVKILTRSKNIKWTEIGENCLHIAYKEVMVPRLRLAVDAVSPYCWTDNQKFLVKRFDEEHAKFFNPSSICYMLSHHMIKGLKDYPSILDNNTYFSYLVRKSNENSILTSA